jgi:AcrR family transcriptional regulator
MATRTDKRRERTRDALIAAAQRILVEKGTTNVPIQTITATADVGAGSFYNHFTTKEELFDAAVSAAIDAHSLRLDEALAAVTDPVQIFATSFRLTARLAATSPAVAVLFVNSGFERLTSDAGLAPRALTDLQRMADHGLLRDRNPHLALATAAGCLFAYMRLRTQQPPSVTDEDADQLTEDLLVMLGVRRSTARRVAHLPLPATPQG